MSKWANLYKEEIKSAGGNKKFLEFKVKEKKPLLKRIKNNSNSGRILESGCGTGVLSTYLSLNGYHITAIDLDKDILEIAKKISFENKGNVDFIMGDILKLDFLNSYFDVVFSHGVLEHFSDEDIIKIIKKQLEIGKKVVFSVPSDFFSESQKMHGDERFLNIQKWFELINSAGGDIKEVFGYWFQNKFHKILNDIFKNSMINKAPYLGFIIETKIRK